MKDEFESFEDVLTELFLRGIISRRECQYRKSLLRAGGGAMATAGLRHLYKIDEKRERYILTSA